MALAVIEILNNSYWNLGNFWTSAETQQNSFLFSKPHGIFSWQKFFPTSLLHRPTLEYRIPVLKVLGIILFLLQDLTSFLGDFYRLIVLGEQLDWCHGIVHSVRIS